MFRYNSQALPEDLIESTKNFLEQKVPWRTIEYYSRKQQKLITTPRQTWVCGFHQNNLYDFENIQPNSFPKDLHKLIYWMQEYTQAEYNFLLFAKYEKGTDSITWHSDDEKFITLNAPITSLTILENEAMPRRFYLKNIKTKEKHFWDLKTGDILKMDYECQKHYQHAILKQPNVKGTRYSITFRNGKNIQATKNYYTYN